MQRPYSHRSHCPTTHHSACTTVFTTCSPKTPQKRTTDPSLAVSPGPSLPSFWNPHGWRATLNNRYDTPQSFCTSSARRLIRACDRESQSEFKTIWSRCQWTYLSVTLICGSSARLWLSLRCSRPSSPRVPFPAIHLIPPSSPIFNLQCS